MPDPHAGEERERERRALQAEQARFAKAVRRRRFGSLRDVPNPILFLGLTVVGTVGGCYSGAAASRYVGTVGDMAGELQTLGRSAAGGLCGLVLAIVAYFDYRRRRR